MFRKKLAVLIQRLKNYLQFSKSYIKRHNPVKNAKESLIDMIKDYLTVNKKMKMARYRLNYQKYKLQQMEQLIAKSNEHVFLKGKTLDDIR